MSLGGKLRLYKMCNNIQLLRDSIVSARGRIQNTFKYDSDCIKGLHFSLYSSWMYTTGRYGKGATMGDVVLQVTWSFVNT